MLKCLGAHINWLKYVQLFNSCLSFPKPNRSNYGSNVELFLYESDCDVDDKNNYASASFSGVFDISKDLNEFEFKLLEIFDNIELLRGSFIFLTDKNTDALTTIDSKYGLFISSHLHNNFLISTVGVTLISKIESFDIDIFISIILKNEYLSIEKFSVAKFIFYASLSSDFSNNMSILRHKFLLKMVL